MRRLRDGSGMAALKPVTLSSPFTPAKAGVQAACEKIYIAALDPSLRWDERKFGILNLILVFAKQLSLQFRTLQQKPRE